MGLADQIAMREASLELPLDEGGLGAAERPPGRTGRGRRRRGGQQGVPRDAIALRRQVHVRYQGTDTALVVPFGAIAAIRDAFEAGYRQRFAFLMPDRMLVIEAVSVEAVGAGERHDERAHAPSRRRRTRPRPTRVCACTAAPGWTRACSCANRSPPAPRSTARPSLPRRTRPPWSSPAGSAVLTAAGPIELSRVQARATQHAIGTEADPVMLEVFNNLFMNIAEQMGLRLQNTAYSVNIKERLDFSCALFDAEGQLIANAPHMPVHLGSMSESIKTVIERNPRMQPGDVYVLNDPYHGGTHLPDVTVVTPVYLEAPTLRSLPPEGARPEPGNPDPGRTAPTRSPASTSPAAATTPTWAAARRARCRRSRSRSRKRACCSTTSCWCATARCARRR